MHEVHYGLGIVELVFLLVIAFLIGVPLLVGFAFGKKPAVVVAIVSTFVALPFLLFGALSVKWVAVERNDRPATVSELHAEIRKESVEAPVPSDDEAASETIKELRPHAVPVVSVDGPMGEPPDAVVQAYIALLADQTILSDRARPAWADRSPGLDHGVYRWPLKSGLFSTQEECRQALAVAAAQAVAQYGKIYLAEASAADLSQLRPDWFRRPAPVKIDSETYQYHDSERGFSEAGSANARVLDKSRARIRQIASTKASGSASTPLRPFPEVTASGRTNLVEQPLYAEMVESSVGPMQQLYALLEFGDYPRAQLREAWRQAAIPRRLRWAACGFGAVLAIVGVLLAALRFDLASGGKHRGRLRLATTLMILLVVGSAWGLCLL